MPNSLYMVEPQLELTLFSSEVIAFYDYVGVVIEDHVCVCGGGKTIRENEMHKLGLVGKA